LDNNYLARPFNKGFAGLVKPLQLNTIGLYKMTYYDSAENMTITKKRALLEVKNHGASVSEFFGECGVHANYNAQTVLNWLGY
tara:strand:- start:668 stop:916 length:249 start_codon:yes stop_codon:yes gene_type:complete